MKSGCGFIGIIKHITEFAASLTVNINCAVNNLPFTVIKRTVLIVFNGIFGT